MQTETVAIITLCAAASEYFTRPVSPSDVVWSYSGVRPLYDDGASAAQKATRDYVLDVEGEEGGPVALNIFGGKITTYRELASEAIKQLTPFLPQLAGRDWTGSAWLPGGDFDRYDAPTLTRDLAARYPFLGAAQAQRLIRLYGTCAEAWLGDAAARSELGEDFGHGLSAAEVDYLMTHEWARSAEDILWRRTKLGLYFTPAQTARLDAYVTERTNTR